MLVENYRKILSSIPSHVRLIAVSKTHSPEKILELYHAGHRLFGENKVQELISKYQVLPKDIQWHMIGHLQSNKVKYIAPFIAMIHSVDSVKLLDVIEKEARKVNRTIPCLLEVHIAQEESKYGFLPHEVSAFFEQRQHLNYKCIEFAGLMGMATYTENSEQVRSEFSNLATLFKSIREKYFTANSNFNTLSMGMSNDYMIAIEEGSNMIRVGSLIFGERNYANNS
ncbi:MAG: YggS family pyridoxal phosphate-dependent enzyme [Bacteroidales bacterium]|nr:YggS family pyridoxal phosphate-dependent enzyme [Bacteroidales bacterium]